MTNVLVIRLREEEKKNKYMMKDVDRLKNDIQKLQKINEDFSIKLRSQKSLSRMTGVDFSTSGLYDTNRTFDKENKSDYNKKSHIISIENLRNSDHKYGFRENKKSRINSNSINSSSSVHFRSSIIKNSLGMKDFNMLQKETLNINEKISNLRKKPTNDISRDISSRRIDVYNKENSTIVPKLEFEKDQENHDKSNEYKSGFASVRLLSHRMEKPNFVLGERSQNSNINWPASVEKKQRKSFLGERDCFLKEGKDSFVSNENFESRNIKFGVLGEISEVKTPRRMDELDFN